MKMIIKDEAHKKDKVKKVKKQKDDILEMNTETIAKKKKKKKEEEMIVEMSDNNVKKKKRKLTSDVDTVTGDADVGVCKKKRIVENEYSDSAEKCIKDESVKDKKKQKRIKNKSMQTGSSVDITIIEDDDAELDVEKTPKPASKVKKDKKKKTKLPTEEEISVIEIVETKSKKKKSKMAKDCTELELSESDKIENGKGKMKKKDKNNAEDKKVKHEINKDYEVSLSGGNGELPEMDSTKVKKKKKKKTVNEIDTAVDKEINETEHDGFNATEYSETKKKKKNSIGDKEPLLVECEVEVASKRKQKKHSKNIEHRVDINVGDGTKKKKRKIKEEQVDHKESSHMEVVFLSEKAGNTDEVNVNKERRKALQMEIDQASQPKKPAKSLGLGQWGTAEFGSSDQQQKFLRLMGGFKKGFQPAPASGGGNMALGRDAQQQLQQGLLGEFERAHSRRMDSNNKGTGLGFIAPSTKRFSIDVNVTRSTRFDD